MLWAFKLHGCADCGVRYPEVALADLHCDHRDPSVKRRVYGASLDEHGAGSTLTYGGTHDEFLAELLKCDVVCVDCHRKRHRRRRTEAQYEQQALFTGTGRAWLMG